MEVGGQRHATPRPLYSLERGQVTIVQEARWTSGPVWQMSKISSPTGILPPDRLARRKSPYRLSYRRPTECSLLYISTFRSRSGIESRWGRDFPSVETGPGAHPGSCKMGTGSFPGVKCGRGVLLTTHLLLVPRS